MKQAFSIIIIYLAISSCSTSNDYPNINKYIEFDTRFPLIKFDSISKIEKSLGLYYTDSSIYFNPVISEQIGQFTAHQLKVTIENTYDSIFFMFDTPIREIKIAGIKLPISDFLKTQEKFNKKEFESFSNSLFELNKKYYHLYHEDATSLIDRLNSFFAKEIHILHKDKIDYQQWFFGFDSFVIFYYFFNDCKSSSQSEATYFVNNLKYDTLFVKSEIMPELINLIDEHCKQNRCTLPAINAMTDDKYISFQKFNSVIEAEETISVLNKNGIKVELEDTSPPVDLTFVGNTLQNQVRVKIKQSDFEIANQLLENHAIKKIETFTDNHYLHDFTDEELLEIIEKPDEWNKEDYLFAQKLLKIRGKEVSKEMVNELRLKRIEESRMQEKGQTGWLIFGFTSAFFGGIFGIFIGWFHWSFKKTDLTGKQVYAYDFPTRKIGEKIFWIGIISLIVWIFIWIARI